MDVAQKGGRIRGINPHSTALYVSALTFLAVKMGHRWEYARTIQESILQSPHVRNASYFIGRVFASVRLRAFLSMSANYLWPKSELRPSIDVRMDFN